MITVTDGAEDSREGHVNFWDEPRHAILTPMGLTAIERVEDGRVLLAWLSSESWSLDLVRGRPTGPVAAPGYRTAALDSVQNQHELAVLGERQLGRRNRLAAGKGEGHRRAHGSGHPGQPAGRGSRDPGRCSSFRRLLRRHRACVALGPAPHAPSRCRRLWELRRRHVADRDRHDLRRRRHDPSGSQGVLRARRRRPHPSPPELGRRAPGSIGLGRNWRGLVRNRRWLRTCPGRRGGVRSCRPRPGDRAANAMRSRSPSPCGSSS